MTRRSLSLRPLPRPLLPRLEHPLLLRLRERLLPRLRERSLLRLRERRVWPDLSRSLLLDLSFDPLTSLEMGRFFDDVDALPCSAVDAFFAEPRFLFDWG